MATKARKKSQSHVMTDEQYDSVLAGLRLLQCRLEGEDMQNRDLDSIRTNDGEHDGLSAGDIDMLIVGLQFHEITELPQ